MEPIKRTPWWVWVACLTPFGLGAWAPLAPASKRRKPLWALFAILSSLLVVAGIVLSGQPGEDRSAAGGLIILGWVGAIATSLSIRGPYLAAIEPSDWETGKRRAAERLEVRREAIALTESDPALAKELGVGRPDVRGARHAGVVDLNHADARAIAKLPGLDDETADRIVTLREEINGFASLADFGSVTDLDGNQVERLREHAVFLPR